MVNMCSFLPTRNFSSLFLYLTPNICTRENLFFFFRSRFVSKYLIGIIRALFAFVISFLIILRPFSAKRLAARVRNGNYLREFRSHDVLAPFFSLSRIENEHCRVGIIVHSSMFISLNVNFRETWRNCNRISYTTSSRKNYIRNCYSLLTRTNESTALTLRRKYRSSERKTRT